MTSLTSLTRLRRWPGRLLLSSAVLFMTAFLFSCAHTGTSKTAQPEFSLPETYSLYEGAALSPDRWWEGFGSDELNALVEKTLAGSLTLKSSLARLQQSRALAVQAGADMLPDLTLNAGASETRRSIDNETTTSRAKSLSLVSSYELDFWGRMRAKQRSALLDVEASQEELYTAALTLASEVTLKWLESISVRQQLALLEEQLKINKTILDLMELRYLKGFATALDIYQQRQVVAETTAAFPTLEAKLQTLSHELAVLTGNPPLTDMGLKETQFPEIGDLPDRGVPADLLARRPDVRSAGLELMAAGEDVKAARAARLPAVNLSATGGFSSNSFADLLDQWFVTLAANLAYPLYKSGAIKAEVTRQERIVDEKLASYEQTVLDAIREVEDAMVREGKQSEYLVALDEQLAIARDSYREAQQRYRKGLIDYLPALSALISTQRFERTVVQARLEKLNQRVLLHRALGGGWMSEEFEKQIEN